MVNDLNHRPASTSHPTRPKHAIGRRKPLIISKIGCTAHDKASEHWRDLARTWNAHIARIRKNLKSDGPDATEMVVYAEMSEGYAFDATVFAQASIFEAEYAALDALAARAAAKGDGILRGCHILGDARADYSGRPGSGEADFSRCSAVELARNFYHQLA
jgi:hypothetical protein